MQDMNQEKIEIHEDPKMVRNVTVSQCMLDGWPTDGVLCEPYFNVSFRLYPEQKQNLSDLGKQDSEVLYRILGKQLVDAIEELYIERRRMPD